MTEEMTTEEYDKFTDWVVAARAEAKKLTKRWKQVTIIPKEKKEE